MPSAKTYQAIGFVTYHMTIKPRQRELIRSAAIIATAAAGAIALSAKNRRARLPTV